MKNITKRTLTSMLTAACMTAPFSALGAPYEGVFAGSMVCETGAVGILFRVVQDGPITREEFDHTQGVCRSGSGPCNDLHRLKYESSRKVRGTMDVFPLAANPEFQAAQYQITGMGTSYESLSSAASAVAKPNSIQTYLDIQSTATSDLFQSTVSNLSFKINMGSPFFETPEVKIFARVHGPQCGHLTLSRITEATP